MLSDDQIRTADQLKNDGFAAKDIKDFFDRVTKFRKLEYELQEATEAENWDRVNTLDPQLEFMKLQILYGGCDPKAVPVQVLKSALLPTDDPVLDRYYARVSNPASAIRAKCVWCMGGQPSEVAKCEAVMCVLWPFRMGTNPMRGAVLAPVEPIQVEDDDEVVVKDEDEGEDDTSGNS